MKPLLQLAFVGTAVALLCVARGAAAQQATADTAFVLDSLTVTALRTPTRVAEAPYSVEALRRDGAERARPALGLDEAFRGVAGIQVDNRYNFALGERISVRGFGARSQFGVRGVKVIVDGIPATLPDGQSSLSHVDPAAIERVELVRGPASALWGNAAGGVVVLESPAPSRSPMRSLVEVASGSDGLRRLAATTEGTAGGMSHRLSLSHLATDGHREWSSAENLRFTGMLQRATANGEFRVVGGFTHYDARNPGALTADEVFQDRRHANWFNVQNNTGEKGTQAQLGIVWRGALGPGALEVSAYGATKQLENPIPPTIIDVDRVVTGARAVFHATSPLGERAMRWAVGVEADRQRDDRLNHANQNGMRGLRTLDQLETVTSGAVFGQVMLPMADRAQLLGGVRYDRFRFEAEDRLVHGYDPDDSGHREMDAVSPSVGMHVDVREWAHLYANIATSFETPTTTELANRPSGGGGFNPELEPQRTRSFEAGVKGSVGDVASYQLAAYRARVEDALIPFEVPGMPGRQVFRNAGSAVHRGVEASVGLTVMRRLFARLGYTVTDARFERYVVDDVAFDGNRIPGVAPFRFDAALTYREPAGWFVGLDHRRRSRTPVDDANSVYSAGYHVTDVRAGRDGMRLGTLEVSTFAGVSNLFNAEYDAAVTVNAFGQRYFEPAPGRAFYVGARVAFGGE